MSETKPTRPALRYHGGKWMLAPWIIAHLPPHRVYVEPFGGAASVLIRKPRAEAEVYNDLDGEIVNLFRVLRDPLQAEELRRQLELTPFARQEFELSYETHSNPVEQARRTVARSFMAFGSSGTSGRRTGFRADSTRLRGAPSRDWMNVPEAIAAVAGRFRGVTIENRDACEVMARHDAPETLHYVDPPYLPETRNLGSPYCKKGQYRHELTRDQHADLLEFVRGLSGYVVLSGYDSELYNTALRGWVRVERRALATGARPRTEVLWINRPSQDVLAVGGVQ